MRAVIASLLDLPLDQVPHFAKIHAEGGENFWVQVADFCASHGYAFVSTRGTRFFWSDEAIYHGISGPSPRGSGELRHSVVGNFGYLAHDPHPSRAGLAGGPSDWEYFFLVKP